MGKRCGKIFKTCLDSASGILFGMQDWHSLDLGLGDRVVGILFPEFPAQFHTVTGTGVNQHRVLSTHHVLCMHVNLESAHKIWTGFFFPAAGCFPSCRGIGNLIIFPVNNEDCLRESAALNQV